MTINPELQVLYTQIVPGLALQDGKVLKLLIEQITESGVNTITIVPSDGITGTVNYVLTNAAITLALGAITPASVASVGAVTGSNLSGTNTGDQTIILTGDVTGAGTGSFAATIGSGAVSLTKMANLAADSIIGNNTGSDATPIALTTSQTKTLLSLNNVENTALSTWAGSTNLVTLGTLNNIMVTGGSITGMPAPMNPSDVSTKAYTDSVASGSSTVVACNVASTTAFTVTYSNGTAGVGATLTNAGTQAALTIDTVNVIVGNRVLVKDQVSTFQNGIYAVTNIGSGSSNWVLTRTTDYDQNTEILNGSTTTILQGASYPTGNLGTQWFMSGPTPTTIGTDPITFGIKSANFLIASSNLSDVVSASTSRTNLGLGTIATQAASSVALTGGTIDAVAIGLTTPVQAQGYYNINAQTGTTYTFVITDNGRLITGSNTGAITWTIPTNASVAFPVGTRIDLLPINTGIITLSPAGGVTLNSKGSKVTLTGSGSPGSLIKLATNTWELIGDLA